MVTVYLYLLCVMVFTTVRNTKTNKAATAGTVQVYTAVVVPQCVCTPVMCVTAGRSAHSMMMSAFVILPALMGVCALDMPLPVLSLFRSMIMRNYVIWMPEAAR